MVKLRYKENSCNFRLTFFKALLISTAQLTRECEIRMYFVRLQSMAPLVNTVKPALNLGYQHHPWLTILACLLLPNIIRLICLPHIVRPVPSDQPVSSAITDLVSRHQNLSLCVNTRAPGTYLGTSKFKVMELGTRHAATISILMLFVCGDVQLNPGPVPTHANASTYPCGFCELHVNWSDAAVCCDECSHWFHKTCLSMSSPEFSGIPNVSWKCIKCTTLNCSSFLYQGYNINTSNPTPDAVQYNRQWNMLIRRSHGRQWHQSSVTEAAGEFPVQSDQL